MHVGYHPLCHPVKTKTHTQAYQPSLALRDVPISNLDNQILLKTPMSFYFLVEVINQVKVLVYCLEMTKVKLVLRDLGSRMTLSCGWLTVTIPLVIRTVGFSAFKLKCQTLL